MEIFENKIIKMEIIDGIMHATYKRGMKIELAPYEHTIAEGCCYTTGYDVFIDGEKIGETIDEDAQYLAELLNEYFEKK
jgi:hypothetical protein